MRIRQGWIGIIGDLVVSVELLRLLWRNAIKPLLNLVSFGGDIDFILEHHEKPGWVGAMIDFFGHPLVQTTIIGIGLGLIFWDNRRRSATDPPLILRIPHLIVVGLTLAAVGIIIATVGWLRSPTTGAVGSPQVVAVKSAAPIPVQQAPHPAMKLRYESDEIGRMLKMTGALRDIVDKKCSPTASAISTALQTWRRDSNTEGAAGLATRFNDLRVSVNENWQAVMQVINDNQQFRD
jgi:hypothetical protein